MEGTQPLWREPGTGSLAGAGVLVCHGFTGTPESVRGWAEYLADQGAAVALPLLPGHGTSWQQMNLTTHHDWFSVLPPALDWLAARSRIQVVCGLSMGGALALRVAQTENVAAVVLVNPSIGSDEFVYRLVPLLARLLPAAKGVGSDIKRPGVVEPAYPLAPLKAVASMRKLWQQVSADLGRVRAPVLLFTSREDHVVDGYSGRILRAQLPQVVDYWLDDSYHVATMDNDAELIKQRSAQFIAELLQAEP